MAKQKFKTFKKEKTMLPLLIGILVLIAAAIFVLKFTSVGYFLRCHLSSAPRMSCKVSVQMDGKPIWDEGGLEVQGMEMGNGEPNTVSDWQVIPGKGGEFRCKGGEYGLQPFMIRFFKNSGSDAVAVPVNVVIPSNWAMSEVDLQIEADSKTEAYEYTIKLTLGDDEFTNSGSGKFGKQEPISISGV